MDQYQYANLNILPLTQLISEAEKLGNDLHSHLPHLNDPTLTCYVDIACLSFLVKETVRFGDMLLLAKHGRFFGVQRMFRGLWESRIILRYLMDWMDDPEEACNAYILFVDYSLGVKLERQTNIPWVRTDIPSIISERKQPFDELPDDLQKHLKVNLKEMCDRLEEKYLQNKEYPPTFKNEYDVFFRVQSDHVHGGLSGATEYFDWLDNDMQPCDLHELEVRSNLGTARMCMIDIVLLWLSHTENLNCRRILMEILKHNLHQPTVSKSSSPKF